MSAPVVLVLDPLDVRLAADLGKRPVMILRDHGLLSDGESPKQAFLRMRYLNRACEIQIDAQVSGARRCDFLMILCAAGRRRSSAAQPEPVSRQILLRM